MRSPRSGPYSHSYPGDDMLFKALVIIAAVVVLAYGAYWDVTNTTKDERQWSPVEHESPREGNAP